MHPENHTVTLVIVKLFDSVKMDKVVHITFKDGRAIKLSPNRMLQATKTRRRNQNSNILRMPTQLSKTDIKDTISTLLIFPSFSSGRPCWLNDFAEQNQCYWNNGSNIVYTPICSQCFVQA